MSKELQKIEGFRYKVAIAETFEDMKKLENVGAAIAEFARLEDLSYEKQNEIGFVRIELEQKKGAWLNENFPHGADRKSENIKVPDGNLDRMPATKKESSRARLISETAAGDIEEVVQTIINSGDVITPKKVENELRKNKKKKTVKEKIEKVSKISSNNFVDIYNTDKKYNLIYADPPWKYNKDEAHFGQSIDFHYPQMTPDEIYNYPVSQIADKNCVLYLWATAPKLDIAMEAIIRWGFDYKTCMVWDKVSHNMGYYSSVRHELLLIAGRGSSAPDDAKAANQTDSVQVIERTEHSVKPDEFYEIIERLHVAKTKIELFARRTRPGWDFSSIELKEKANG